MNIIWNASSSHGSTKTSKCCSLIKSTDENLVDHVMTEVTWPNDSHGIATAWGVWIYIYVLQKSTYTVFESTYVSI